MESPAINVFIQLLLATGWNQLTSLKTPNRLCAALTNKLLT